MLRNFESVTGICFLLRFDEIIVIINPESSEKRFPVIIESTSSMPNVTAPLAYALYRSFRQYSNKRSERLVKK